MHRFSRRPALHSLIPFLKIVSSCFLCIRYARLIRQEELQRAGGWALGRGEKHTQKETKSRTRYHANVPSLRALSLSLSLSLSPHRQLWGWWWGGGGCLTTEELFIRRSRPHGSSVSPQSVTCVGKPQSPEKARGEDCTSPLAPFIRLSSNPLCCLYCLFPLSSL